MIVGLHGVNIRDSLSLVIDWHAPLVSETVKAHELVIRGGASVAEDAHYDIRAWHLILPEANGEPVPEGAIRGRP